MKIIKYILITLLSLWLLSIAYLYITGERETFLIRAGYEGPLIIIGNQKDGIVINRKDAVYDFTKSNIIKLKGDIVTGFSPWGYLNYYMIDSNKVQHKMEIFEDEMDGKNLKDYKTYVWDYYNEIGGCQLKQNNKTNYEILIIGKKSSISRILDEKERLINEYVCK